MKYPKMSEIGKFIETQRRLEVCGGKQKED
jgi:hypothetical protein